MGNVIVTAPDSNTTCLHCEEKCDKIAFRNEISSGFYPNLVQEYPEALYKRYSFTKEDLNSYAQTNLVKLNVFMKSAAGTSYIMDQRVTWSDFVSSTGGVLGLGFGFSLISIIEVFYFSLIRWVFSKQPLAARISADPLRRALIWRNENLGDQSSAEESNFTRILSHGSRINCTLGRWNARDHFKYTQTY